MRRLPPRSTTSGPRAARGETRGGRLRAPFDHGAADAGRPPARRQGGGRRSGGQADHSARARRGRDRGARGPRVLLLGPPGRRAGGLDRRVRPGGHPVPQHVGPDDRRRAPADPAVGRRRLLLGGVLPDEPRARRPPEEHHVDPAEPLRGGRPPRGDRHPQLLGRAAPVRGPSGGGVRLRRPVRDQGPGPGPQRHDQEGTRPGDGLPVVPLRESSVRGGHARAGDRRPDDRRRRPRVAGRARPARRMEDRSPGDRRRVRPAPRARTSRLRRQLATRGRLPLSVDEPGPPVRIRLGHADGRVPDVRGGPGSAADLGNAPRDHRGDGASRRPACRGS